MKCFVFIILFCLPLSCLADERVIDYVLVKKAERIMQLLSSGEVIKQYRIALGANPKGHKLQEGDERTPEGTYVLDYKNENSSFFKSIHISYPNQSDTDNAESKGVNPGGMIMIHGQRNGFDWLSKVTQKYDWTDGCIAVTNSEMKEIWELVAVGTLIEIQD